MKQIILYTTPTCSKCKDLIEWLQEQGIPFETRNLQNPAVLTDLALDDMFPLEAPLLKIGSIYHPSGWLFPGGRLNAEKLWEALHVA